MPFWRRLFGRTAPVAPTPPPPKPGPPASLRDMNADPTEDSIRFLMESKTPYYCGECGTQFPNREAFAAHDHSDPYYAKRIADRKGKLVPDYNDPNLPSAPKVPQR